MLLKVTFDQLKGCVNKDSDPPLVYDLRGGKVDHVLVKEMHGHVGFDAPIVFELTEAVTEQDLLDWYASSVTNSFVFQVEQIVP